MPRCHSGTGPAKPTEESWNIRNGTFHNAGARGWPIPLPDTRGARRLPRQPDPPRSAPAARRPIACHLQQPEELRIRLAECVRKDTREKPVAARAQGHGCSRWTAVLLRVDIRPILPRVRRTRHTTAFRPSIMCGGVARRRRTFRQLAVRFCKTPRSITRTIVPAA
jgi:hypothetical protein